MKRRNRAQESAVDPQGSGIPPFIDQFGREVWDNPWGQYRPNPRLAGETRPVVRSATGLPVIPKPTAENEPAPAESAPEATPTPAAPAVAPPVELAPTTHQVTDNGRIEADDERIRSTIQYAKGYAKACKALGIEIPDEMRDRLKRYTAQRRGRVHKRVRRTVVAATAVGAGFVGINAAAAYWTAHGSGSGAGSIGSQAAVTVAATGTPATDLVPNNGTADLALAVTNPNPYPVTITDISQGVGSIGVTGAAGTCTTTGVSVPTQSGLSVSVTAVNGASQTVHIANGAKMDTTSDNGCQNGSFSIPVTLTVKQS